MRSFSDLCLLVMPTLVALLLLALFTAPLASLGFTLVPNIVWIFTLVIAMRYPSAWPVWLAFFLGLLQDVLFATPLGAQGLLALLLHNLAVKHGARHPVQRFRIRWLEAAGVLVLWHVLLWGILNFVHAGAPPLRALVQVGIVSALWYPIFYVALARWAALMPAK